MPCRTCKKVKPLDEFSPRERRSDTLIYRNRSCRACRARVNRDLGLRKRYGISADDYDFIFAQQRGVCALCERKPIENEVFSVDHEHSTGRIRGIVCQPCNVAIGFFETRIDVERMRQYLSVYASVPDQLNRSA